MDNNIKGIIFDMDGTLLLSMHVWDNAGSGFLKRHGVTPDPDTDELVKSMTIEQAAERAAELGFGYIARKHRRQPAQCRGGALEPVFELL